MATSGPYTIVKGNSFNYYKVATWYRQTKPRLLRLPYTMRETVVLERRGRYWSVNSPASDGYFSTSSDRGEPEAYNDAYAKFVQSCGDSASWAVSLAERKQAVDMIVKRALQLYRFARCVRKGYFGDAAKELGISTSGYQYREARLSRKHQFSNNYLEFHFGWAPLMSDIHTSVKILGRDFPVKPIKGRGSATASGQTTGTTRTSATYVTRCQIIADLSAVNPNLLLLSQLGLVNPAVVAWELVPFSFVLDWFVNVGEFLQHYTNFVGLDFSNQAVTYVTQADNVDTYIDVDTGASYTRKTRQINVRRSTGSNVITGPTIRVRPFNGFSVRRGLAAISLLIQQGLKR